MAASDSELTVDDLTPTQRKAYDTLIKWFNEGRFEAFYGWGRQSGKTTVLRLALKEIERLDKHNE